MMALVNGLRRGGSVVDIFGHDRTGTGPEQYDFVLGNGAFKSCIGVCMIAIRFGSDSRTLICQDSTGSIALAFPDFIALAVLHWLC